MPNYKEGKIYRIINNHSDDVYVGSTTQPLCHRMALHRQDAQHPQRCNYPLYKLMNEIGVQHFKIELLEKFPCDTKQELNTREGYWQKQEANPLHKYIAGRSPQTYYQDNINHIQTRNKEYNNTHREHLKQKKDIYRQVNRDTLNQKKKDWYYENKEHVLQQHKEVFECECGMTLTRGHKARHLKSQFHINHIKNKNNNIENDRLDGKGEDN